MSNSRLDFKDTSFATNLTTTTATQQITSLPSTAVKGEMVGELQGQTVVNILPDAVAGCESATNFTGTNATLSDNTANKLEGTNCMKILITDVAGTADYDVLAKLTAGRYYLLSAYIKNGNATNINLELETDDQDINSSLVTATTYTRVGIVIAPTDFDTASSAVLRFNVTGANTNYAYADAIMLQEITATEYALGATALLSKYAWHLGVEDTNAYRVKSIAKNFFNKERAELNYYVRYTDGAIIAANGYIASEFIAIDSSTVCKISGGSLVSGADYAFYDDKKNYISGATNIYNPSFTTPSNARYIRFTGLIEYLDTIQLELGTTATTYEVYKETTSYTTQTLKRISSTVYDTLELNKGKVTKNIESDMDVSSTQYDSLDKTTYTNVDVIKTTAFSSAVAGTTGIDGKTLVINSSNVILSEVAQANIDLVASVGKYYYHTDKTVWFIVAADTYVDIAAARTGLATSKIYYQLATSVVTYPLSQVLQSEPSGTVIIEPVIRDAGFYTTTIAIENTSYPISSLDYVYKVNPADGTMTPISLSSCTVAAGGLTFTISGAVAGEMYAYAYLYSNLSTIPSFAYSYNTNLKAQVNSNTESCARLDDKIEIIESIIETKESKIKFTPEGGLAIKLTNKTGGASVKGEVVTVYNDSAINNAVEKIVVDIPSPIGVFYESGVADGSEAWIVVSGIADVYFIGNTTIGHLARGFITGDAGYVTGQVLSEAVPSTPFATDKHFYEIGHVLESRTGAGLAKCVLHFN